MKKISVNLDDITIDALETITSINNCSISDAVNAAIIAYSKDTCVTIHSSPRPIDEIIALLPEGVTLGDWCEQRNIDVARLRYLVDRTAKGGTVWGFGNSRNKVRDQDNDRIFKTHTAWIAHCLKEDLGVDIT